MAEKVQQQQNTASAGLVDHDRGWGQLVPKSVDYEDAMNAFEVKKVWAKMYREAKLDKPSEDKQKAFRLAVYVYGVKNGTSRAGNYAGTITLNDGHTFNASVIPICTGAMAIRKFFRGNAAESYEALKYSGVIEMDARYVARVSMLGISADCAFATADWLTYCPKMTPREVLAHEASLNRSLQRARRARDGNTLEDVERKRGNESLEAQGRFDRSDHLVDL